MARRGPLRRPLVDIRTIVIANVAEAFGDILARVRDRTERRFRVQREHDLAQRAFFWEGDRKLVITPVPIAAALRRQGTRACGYVNVATASPSRVDISLCEAISSDSNLFGQLVGTIRTNPEVRVSPYADTPDFRRLIDRLRQCGLQFDVDISAGSTPAWLRPYLDSKLGFRLEVMGLQRQLRSAHIPRGFVCRNVDDVVGVVGLFHRRRRSCVAKANEGESGWGLVILPARSSNRANRRLIDRCFSRNSPWRDSPIIVEEFISSRTSSSASPSAEVFVSDVSARVTYVCAQSLGTSGNFQGVVLGRGVLKTADEIRIRRAASIIARRYQQLGYRGFFDLDCVIASDGELYLVETNARRTGGTHVYDLARHLFGADWRRRAYFASNDAFRYGDKRLTAKAIGAKMKKLLFPMAGAPQGIVLTLVSRHTSSFGFVLIAPTARHARQLYQRVLDVWRY